jgi:hypothetical protein
MMKRILTTTLAALMAAVPALAQTSRTLLRGFLERHVPGNIFPNDLTLTGEVTDWSGRVQPVRILIKGKDQIRYEFGTGASAIITVYGKGGGWAQRNGKRQFLEPHSAQRPAVVPFLDLLSDIDANDLQITERGAATLGGVTLQRFTLKLPDRTPNVRAFRRPLDEEVDVYLNPQTGLVARAERTLTANNDMNLHARSSSDFSDYRMVQGFAIPFRIVTSISVRGTTPAQSVYVIQSVRVNTGIADATFAQEAGQ